MPTDSTDDTGRFRVVTASDVEERRTDTGLFARRVFDAGQGLFESSFQFVLKNRLPPGEKNVRHVHEDVEKVYYFLGGGGDVSCGPWRRTVAGGDFLFFPANIEHEIENTGDVDMVFIVVAARTLGEAKGLES
jgi:mannose-6-phosphate isomerase-like protein (cupin superfamily)